jgi:hypothetical protein
MIKRIILVSVIALALIVSPLSAQAKFLFHATKKAAAKKIASRGFATKKMNPKARFGKGVYLAESKKLALKEKPSAGAVIRFKDTKFLHRNSINIKDLTRKELKLFSGDRDLRGNIHKGIIRGDLAKKTGKAAGRYGMVVTYPSAKGKGLNTFIPKKVYEAHPRIVPPKGSSVLRK